MNRRSFLGIGVLLSVAPWSVVVANKKELTPTSAAGLMKLSKIDPWGKVSDCDMKLSINVYQSEFADIEIKKGGKVDLSESDLNRLIKQAWTS